MARGTGKIKTSLIFIDLLEHKIDMMVNMLNNKSLYLHVHPFIEAYISKGFLSRKLLWKLKYGFGVHIIPNQSLSFLEYKFYDKNQAEINLKEENEMN